MTLVAAFRCDFNGESGVIICADSQESYGDYCVKVDKIKPRDANHYDLVIGGSGNVGSLIDGLSNTIERKVKSFTGNESEEEVRTTIENVVANYGLYQVEAYQAPRHDKAMQFILKPVHKSGGDSPSRQV